MTEQADANDYVTFQGQPFLHFHESIFETCTATEGNDLVLTDHLGISLRSKMRRHNGIQLLRNFRKLLVQIQRFNTDLVSTHLVYIIRLDYLVRSGVQQHPGHFVRLVAEFCIPILHIGEDLIQVGRMERMNVIVRPETF